MDKTNTPKKLPLCHYSHEVAELLHQLNISLVATLYMEGKLIFFSPLERNNTISLIQFPRNFKRPTGIVIQNNLIYLSTYDEVIVFNGSEILAKNHKEKPNTYDIVFQPVASYHTGYLNHHDSILVENQYITVSSLFSCLGKVDGIHSFSPTWKPFFVTSLVPEDRCHLNGVAVEHNKPKYASSFCQSSQEHTWRTLPTNQGVIIDVETNNILAEGFIRPHSPRIYKGDLYLLNSAEGALVKVDRTTGNVVTLAVFPGFTRGLSFYEDYAFVGLSKLREGKNPLALEFPIYKSDAKLKSGIAVWQLSVNRLVGFIEYTTEITEVYDVAILENYRRPMIFNTISDSYRKSFILPNDAYWEMENIET